MKKLLAAAGFLALAASPARAENGSSFMGGVMVGAAFPGGDLNDEDEANLDPGWSFGGFVGGRFSGPWGWRVEGAWNQFALSDEDEEFCDASGLCDKPSVFHGGGGLQISTTGNGKGVGWGYATIGAYNIDSNIEGLDSETNFGLGVGAGAGWRLSDKLTLGGDARIDIFFPEDDSEIFGPDAGNQWWFTLSAVLGIGI